MSEIHHMRTLAEEWREAAETFERPARNAVRACAKELDDLADELEESNQP